MVWRILHLKSGMNMEEACGECLLPGIIATIDHVDCSLAFCRLPAKTRKLNKLSSIHCVAMVIFDVCTEHHPKGDRSDRLLLCCILSTGVQRWSAVFEGRMGIFLFACSPVLATRGFGSWNLMPAGDAQYCSGLERVLLRMLLTCAV